MLALAKWTWKMQWARQLNPASRSTGRINMKEAMSTGRMNRKDAMNDKWLPYLQALAKWTWKTQWTRQLTPTFTSSGRMNIKEVMGKTTNSHIYKYWQNEHERSNDQDNWLSHLKALAEWTWKSWWTRQLTPTSTSTCRMNMKDAMSKTTDSLIYKH